MKYQIKAIADLAAELEDLYDQSEDKSAVLKDKRLGSLMTGIKDQPPEQRAAYGQEVNQLKQHLQTKVSEWRAQESYVAKGSIDVTAPFDLNQNAKPDLVAPELGSMHPITEGIQEVSEIFARMGFETIESRQLDNQYYMFDSLNFPAEHPARDEYDTFMLGEQDDQGRPLVAPAHTSVMQHRIIKERKQQLERGEAIAAVVPGRVFRNEDLDATHEHTFHQVEGIYVAKDVTAGSLIATFKAFAEEYFGKSLEVKTQPFYFPFTEPSFEFAVSSPFKQGAWLELGGCGMIHPNVLSQAGVDPEVYTGFAWGFGLERMVMIKHGIDDVRYFHSGKLDFLRQFSGAGS